MSKKFLLVLVILSGFFLLKVLGLDSYLSIDYFNANQEILRNLYSSNPISFSFIFLSFYILVTMFSVPAAVPLTMFAGSIFGLYLGIVIVSLASTIGATFAFLLSRYLFKDLVVKKYSERLDSINSRLRKHGIVYLFLIRLIPAFPFFLVNIVMGLTEIKTLTFFWVSMLGMLLGTIIYVNAGAKLIDINGFEDLYSIESLATLSLILGLIMIGKKFKNKLI